MIVINVIVKPLLALHVLIAHIIRKFFSLEMLALVIAPVAAFSRELHAPNVMVLVLLAVENHITNA